jgi:hypothetical protein
MFAVSKEIRAGNPVIPVGLKILLDKLSPGAYTAEVKAMDALGNSKMRTADFDLE